MGKVSTIKIFKGVKLGKNSIIEEGVIIGQPFFSKNGDKPQTIIGDNAYIRTNTIIYAGVKIGHNFQTGPNVLIRENNIIGNGVVVWHGTTLNPGNIIGDNSRVHSGCFLEMVTLGKNVFLGPHVVFTDDPHPIIPIAYRRCWGGAKVGEGSAIGGNTTILPHITIGKNSVIGAGSVVARDIADNKVAVGNPAKEIKKTSDLSCDRTGKKHFPYRFRKFKD